MSRELILFFCFFWRGAFLILIYDSLRIFRRVCHCSKYMVGLQDLLYWLFAAMYLFIGMYRENSGLVRGYLLAGLLCGCAAWYYSFSRGFVKLGSLFLEKLTDVIRMPFRTLKKLRKRLKFSRKQDRMFLCRRRRQRTDKMILR